MAKMRNGESDDVRRWCFKGSLKNKAQPARKRTVEFTRWKLRRRYRLASEADEASLATRAVGGVRLLMKKLRSVGGWGAIGG